MLDFIIKYWLTAVFGLIATGLGLLARHYSHLLRKEKSDQKKEEFDNLIKDMKAYVDESFKDTEESHKKLYKAVLDVQSKQFQRDCYTYLKSERDITLEEFDSLYRNFEIYKSIGGNGIGTMLFEKVEEKYSTQLMTAQIMDAAANISYHNQNMPPQHIIYTSQPPKQPIYNRDEGAKG